MGLPQTSPMERQMSNEMAGDPVDRSALHLLHRAGQCAGVLFQVEMARGELTPRQFAILASVAADEGASQARLVEKTGIDRSTLADVVRRMLKKGLLARERTKNDARAYAVKLTSEGRRALNAARPVMSRVEDKLLSGLPERQRSRFLKDLGLIVDSLAHRAPNGDGRQRG